MLTSLWCCCHPIPALVHCLFAVFSHVTFFLSASHSSIYISNHRLSVHLSVPPSAHCPSLPSFVPATQPPSCPLSTAGMPCLRAFAHAWKEGSICGLYPPGFLPLLLSFRHLLPPCGWAHVMKFIVTAGWLTPLPPGHCLQKGLLTGVSPILLQYLEHGRCSKNSCPVDKCLGPVITELTGEL